MENPNTNYLFLLGLSKIYEVLFNFFLHKINNTPDFNIRELDETIGKISKEIVENLIESSSHEAEKLTETDCRKDLRKTDKPLWSQVVEQFYDQHGYKITINDVPLDHLLVHFAFLSHLFNDAAETLKSGNEKEYVHKVLTINRFITSHTLPLINGCTKNNALAKTLKPLITRTIEYVRPLAIKEVSKNQ